MATKKKTAKKKASKKTAAKKKTVRKKSTRKKSTKKARKKTSRKKAARRPTPRALAALETRRERARLVLRFLHELYGDADCALEHRNAFELLIATILSAQSTDVNVNKATPALFRRFPTAAKLAAAPIEEVEELVHSTGFFRQKAKNIVGCAQRLIDEFGGEVPRSIPELTSLPGVARKTANVVLGTWFGQNEGVVVDTHVGRIAERLDLVWNHKDTKDAVKIEQDLMQVLPQEEWTFFSHAIIWHGRGPCPARKPACDRCEIAPHCPSAGIAV